VLLTLALCTVFVGSMLAYREKLLKRRLAYSTVSQVSYVLFGLFLFTPAGVLGALLQLVFHALAKDVLFLAAGAVIFATNRTPGGPAPGIGRRIAGDHVVLYPGRPVPHWHPRPCRLSQQVVSGDGGAGGGFPGPSASPGWWCSSSSALLTAGYLSAHRHWRAFFPGRDFNGERKKWEKTMLAPMLCFRRRPSCWACFPATLMSWLGGLIPKMVLNSAGKEAHACFDFSICPSYSPC
jgi:multicomponent Na+:H+ antiporter subunit D